MQGQREADVGKELVRALWATLARTLGRIAVDSARRAKPQLFGEEVVGGDRV